VPAIVIHGSEDAALPAAVAQRVASGIPGTRLVWIDGAGHSSPFEASDAISDAIEHFFAAVSAAEPRA
jgi:pimeloyl-ACP methyl ester carboxylesterase